MKILVRYPSREDLSTIVTRTTQKEEAHLRTILNREEIHGAAPRRPGDVLVAPLHVQSYAIDLVMATQPGFERVTRAGEKVHSLRQFAARGAGAGRVRPGIGIDARTPAFVD